MHEPAEGGPVDVLAGQQALEVGRHAEGGGGPQPGDGARGPLDVEGPGQQHLAPGQQRVHREAQRSAVVQRREHQVPVVRAETPQPDLLGGQRPGVVLGEDAGPHALAPARRPGRVVHRPGERHVGELGLAGAGEQPGGVVGDVEREADRDVTREAEREEPDRAAQLGSPTPTTTREAEAPAMEAVAR